jgi:hypothetical protein
VRNCAADPVTAGDALDERVAAAVLECAAVSVDAADFVGAADADLGADADACADATAVGVGVVAPAAGHARTQRRAAASHAESGAQVAGTGGRATTHTPAAESAPE